MNDKLAKYYVVLDSCLFPLSNDLFCCTFQQVGAFSKHLGSLLYRAPTPIERLKHFTGRRPVCMLLHDAHVLKMSFYAY